MNRGTLRTLWGLAKSPELRMTDEELHLFVQAQTGKESLKELTAREIKILIGQLANMKESSRKEGQREKRKVGSTSTEGQRKKVYHLARALGWEKPARINGFCKRMFRTERVEWLSYEECSKLIEILKKMVEEVEGAKG